MVSVLRSFSGKQGSKMGLKLLGIFFFLSFLYLSYCQQWKKSTGLDCYDGNGGDPIQPDPYSNNLSVQECRDVCQQDSTCEGIIRKASEKQAKGICYKRKNLQLGECVQDAIWDLHQKTSKEPVTSDSKFLIHISSNDNNP